MNDDNKMEVILSRRTALQGSLSTLVLASLFPVVTEASFSLRDSLVDQARSTGLTDLAGAWIEFCERLAEAGRIPLDVTLPGTEQDRVAGYLQIVRNLSLAFDFFYEYADPLFPYFFRYFGPTRKQGGDNSDSTYVGATINGEFDYEISGVLGSARYLSIVIVDEGNTPWGGKSSRPLFRDDIIKDADGQFKIIISQNPHSENWIQSTPKSFRVTIRQYFADWENEVPMKATIERISGPQIRAPSLSQAALTEGLVKAASWVCESVVYWSEMLERWRPYRNHFKSYWDLEKNAIDAAPGGDPLVCFWELGVDEALVIRVIPPACPYWSVEFGDCWWETVDYRYRLSNTNMHYAQLESNGELIVVVSHVDPGVPNWLDCAGFSRGYVTYRWMLSAEQPRPRAKQVKFDELMSILPKNVKTITPDERKEQIAARRRGVFNRFGYA